MKDKQYKQLIQAALVVLAASLVCIRMPHFGWSRYEAVKESVSQDLPLEVTFDAQYGQMDELRLKADTSMAAADTQLQVCLYDDKDRLVYTNLIPLKELSVYEWAAVAQDLYLTQDSSYTLRLSTSQDSEILSQAYLYSIAYRYYVPFTQEEYVPYQLLVAFAAAMLILTIYTRGTGEHAQENRQKKGMVWT